MEAVWITILTIGSQITTMCTIGCAFYAEVDRPSVIDALDDIFLKIQKKTRICNRWLVRKKNRIRVSKNKKGGFMFLETRILGHL